MVLSSCASPKQNDFTYVLLKVYSSGRQTGIEIFAYSPEDPISVGPLLDAFTHGFTELLCHYTLANLLKNTRIIPNLYSSEPKLN